MLITNFLEWRWYYKNNEVKRIKLGEFVAKTDCLGEKNIKPLKENFNDFNQIITEFLRHKTEITNAETLSYRMGEQARMLRDEILKLFDKPNSSVIKSELKTIQENLKKDTTKEDFADMKAQMTIYGIFIAKLYYGDKQTKGFELESIFNYIPHSNSFLQQLFYTQNNPFYMEKTIKTIIDRSIEMMASTDVVKILDDFAKKNKTSTAIVEFYETFLEKYDPKLRAEMGVWYTPQPIVDFIVRQIDLILINVFNIKDGIINTDEVGYNKEGKIDKFGKPVESQPQVQVLDPATGTGTFVVEYIRLAFEKFMKTGKYNQWSSFVEKHLLKNINAFEIMMCPYVLAHLQIDIILQQFGTNAANFISEYIKNNNIFPDPQDKKLLLEGFIWKRFCKTNNINEAIEKYSGYHIADKDNNKFNPNIFLTNSLDDWNDSTDTSATQDLFGDIIEREGTMARKIKQQQHIMVVMGNPPYNASTMNKGRWIMGLLEDYKYEKDKNGNKIINLLEGEKNIKPLSDDYVKFIRYGENYIEKNDRGILSFITNNSYLDGCTHRGMRKHLLKTFDDIYIFNLHGDARRDKDLMKNNNDQNPFNIMQGVAISIFVKKPHDEDIYTAKQNNTTYTKPLATVHYKDLIGTRYDKFMWLIEYDIFKTSENNSTSDYLDFNNHKPVQFDKEWSPSSDDYLFVPKNEEGREEYEKGVRVSEIYTVWNSGFTSHKDDITVKFTPYELQAVVDDFLKLSEDELKIKYNLNNEARDWNVSIAKNDLEKTKDHREIVKICYRLFDERFTSYASSKGFIARPRYELMKNLITSKGFIAYPRVEVMKNFIISNNIALIAKKLGNDVFLTNKITDSGVMTGWSSVFPLYTFTNPTNPAGTAGTASEAGGGATNRQATNAAGVYKQADLSATSSQPSEFIAHRHINFSQTLLKTFAEKLGIPFVESNNDTFAGFHNGLRVSGFWNKYTDKTKFNELHLFDYIYGILNDKEYRNKYKVFLEMDFPRVPYPESVNEFFEYAKRGETLRHLHLMEVADVEKFECVDFEALSLLYNETDKDNNDTKAIKHACVLEGKHQALEHQNKIENVKMEQVENLNISCCFDGCGFDECSFDNDCRRKQQDTNNTIFPACRVWINKYQYLVIPECLWMFKIGSYKPVQEYLKKRKDRIFTEEEQKHFKRMCFVITSQLIL